MSNIHKLYMANLRRFLDARDGVLTNQKDERKFEMMIRSVHINLIVVAFPHSFTTNRIVFNLIVCEDYNTSSEMFYNLGFDFDNFHEIIKYAGVVYGKKYVLVHNTDPNYNYMQKFNDRYGYIHTYI